MRQDIELEAIIEDYLNGKLTPEEQAAFEQLRSNDPMVDHKVVAHKVFLESMLQYAHVVKLKEQMDMAHAQIDVAALAEDLRPHPSKIIQFWRNNKSAVAVAASFVLLSLVTLLSIHKSNQQEGTFAAMSKDMNQIKITQNYLIRDIKNREANKNNNSRNANNKASFGGTGFAISGNGYIVTAYHVVRSADSIYVQNAKGAYKVQAIYTDPVNDVAILKINDKTFESLPSLPYTIKKGMSGLGEAVFTLGFPKDDIVLGDGYVSSKNGINGDTLAYQVAIPVNPGNSGGPLLDNSGNIVGIINGKENKTDGATFAVKSKYIMEALNAIPQDSLSKRVSYGKKSLLKGLKRNKQVEKMQDYVFMIKVYNNN
ncbi:S1C family serine protease [Nubsella zeaxanthinifaciens]|uniref:S1C family serine protease n=1 Tax=Nubsella zeaxanthinifaciens TaxID=392412 RepID=UPI000DE4B036|nr:serine protease [Nubsella zeaxanthinifaciens]